MDIILTFQNTHQALAAEEALLAGGLEVRIMPLPATMGEGCGFCLRLGEGDLARAGQLLEARNLDRPFKIYRRSDAGLADYQPVSEKNLDINQPS
ncbi:MAG: DUF3343 domain-containing protein [Candidatus Adiutrix sp.]|jgi:hypothetical protein|nr:DUF3343 domain-containing protein [Candidatus Adiutrix sp.]